MYKLTQDALGMKKGEEVDVGSEYLNYKEHPMNRDAFGKFTAVDILLLEKNGVIEKVEEKEKKWEPMQNELFFYFDSTLSTWSGSWNADSHHKFYSEVGNCFRTREEALAAVEKIKQVLAGK